MWQLHTHSTHVAAPHTYTCDSSPHTSHTYKNTCGSWELVNNPTLLDFCVSMIGRAGIEGSKSNVAMNAWLPQASYPCGNFSDTSCSRPARSKGSIGRAFAVRIRTGNQDQAGFCPSAPREVSVLAEPALGHLRYPLTDVPPQSNSPPDTVAGADRARHRGRALGSRTGAPRGAALRWTG